MANNVIRGATLALLQALLVTEEAALRFYIPGTIRVDIDPDEGPQYYLNTSSNRPQSVTTLTQYTSIAAAQAYMASVSSPSCDLDVAVLPILGQQICIATSVLTSGTVGSITSATRASASALALVTTVAADVTTLVLGRGEWLVEGQVSFAASGGSVTGTALYAGVSEVANTLPANDTELVLLPTMPTANANVRLALPPVRVLSASGNTIRLVARADFTVNGVGVYGRILALLTRAT